MGYGDEIMASGHARLLRQQTGKRVVIVDRNYQPRWSEVWEGNPNIARVPGPDTIALQHGPSCRPNHVGWDSQTAQWLFNYDYRAPRGDLYLSDAERDHARAVAPGGFWLVEPNINPKNSPNKQWPIDRWQQLVDETPGIHWVQLDYGGPHVLRGVAQVKTQNFRAACAVLELADGAVLHEGGLHHAAAALGIPAVVIFGGFTPPACTGYDGHLNLSNATRFCGRHLTCPDHCPPEMDSITVAQVLDGVNTLQANAGRQGNIKQ